MASPFCSICSGPAVEGASLCALHMAQAAKFALSFGADDAGSSEAAGGSSEPGSGGPRPPRASFPAGTEAERELEGYVETAIRYLTEWVQRNSASARWPLVAFYGQHDAIKVRRYFDVAPAASSSTALAEGFTVTSQLVEQAFAHGSLVRNRLLRVLSENLAALRNAELHMLTVELRAHENALLMATVRPSAARHVIAAFRFDGRDFKSADTGTSATAGPSSNPA